MVDTLYLETENFYLISGEKFLIQGNTTQPESNVLLSGPGIKPKIEGSSAYYTYMPENSHRTAVHFRISTNQYRKFLSIQIASLPRLLFLTNIYPLDTKDEYQRAIENLQTITENAGIKILDWNELTITRIDLSGTFITKRKASLYLDIIKSSNIRGNQKVIRRQGVEFLAQKATYAFYDKAAQMKAIDEYLSDELLHPPDEDKFRSYISTKNIRNHLLRVEFRFREYSSVKTNFSSVRTLGQLLENTDELFIKYFKIFSRVLDEMDGTALIKKRQMKNNQAISNPNTSEKEKVDRKEANPTFDPLKRNYSEQSLNTLIAKAQKEHQKHWLSGLIMDFGYLYIEQNFGPGFRDKLMEIMLADAESPKARASVSRQMARIKADTKAALVRATDYQQILAAASTYHVDFAEFKGQIYRYATAEYDTSRAKIAMGSGTENTVSNDYDIRIINYDPMIRRIFNPSSYEEQADLLRMLEDDFTNFPYLVRLKLPHSEAERLKKIKLSGKK